VDDEVTFLLSRWLGAAGIESRTYTKFDPSLTARPTERPGCVVIDAQQVSTVAPLTRYPIVIIAHRADVATAVRAMKTGAVDFFEKPLREREIIAAIVAAIALDRQRTVIASQLAGVHAQFATLTRREREIMALVTAGNLNKQAGGHLGLSEITVKAHRGSVMRKMGARSLADLVRMAVALGDALTPPAKRDRLVRARASAAVGRAPL
jgi:FixJ family two-component response regulator